MTGLHPTNVGIVTVLFLAGVAGPAIGSVAPAAAERPPDAFFVARAGPAVESGGSRGRARAGAHAFTRRSSSPTGRAGRRRNGTERTGRRARGGVCRTPGGRRTMRSCWPRCRITSRPWRLCFAASLPRTTPNLRWWRIARSAAAAGAVTYNWIRRTAYHGFDPLLPPALLRAAAGLPGRLQVPSQRRQLPAPRRYRQGGARLHVYGHGRSHVADLPRHAGCLVPLPRYHQQPAR